MKGSSERAPRGTVLFLHPSDEAYGADRILLEAILGLRKRGWECHVLLASDSEPGWLSARFREAGIPFKRGPLAPARRRYLRILGLPGYARDLLTARRFVRREVRRVGADIVHVNTSAMLVGALIGRPSGVRVVWHVHEIVIRPRATAWLFRLVPGMASDRVVAVSDAVARHITPRRVFRSRTFVVRNGLPDRPPVALRPRDDGRALSIAYVGRLNRWKGYELFVEAAASLAVDHPGLRFVIAGDPPTGEAWRSDDLRDRIAAARLGDRVDLLGFVNDGSAVLERADIAVVPSTWPDPLPTVVLEAMRAGCVVVAAAHGGAPEMIEDGRSGRLFPPGDVAALRDIIADLVEHPGTRLEIGIEARRRFEAMFSVERMVGDLETIYAGLVP